MVFCEQLDPGLHVCSHAQQVGDDMFCGERCDRLSYEPSEVNTLYAVLVGRPRTIISRELVLVVNGVPADTVLLGHESDNCSRYWLLDEHHVGMIGVVYVENGLDYWRRDFDRGVCVIPPPRQLSTERLVNNLKRIRGET